MSQAHTKECVVCTIPKDLNEYHSNKSSEDGKVNTCKACKKERDRVNRASPESKDKRRWDNLMQRYGITKEEYLSMFQEQEGCCKICSASQLDLKRPLVVDHCHSSMKVRGLLCDNCNNGLGKFKDNLQFLNNAMEYLIQTGE